VQEEQPSEHWTIVEMTSIKYLRRQQSEATTFASTNGLHASSPCHTVSAPVPVSAPATPPQLAKQAEELAEWRTPLDWRRGKRA